MKARRITGLMCAAVLGILTGFWAGSGTGEALFSLPTRAGAGLRTLAQTGFLGNLSAWAAILVVSALPLMLLAFPRGRGSLTGTDALLPLSSLLLFLALFFAVNPTLLNNPLPGYWVLGAAGGALCAVVCWLVLRLLEPMDRRDLPALAGLLALLLTACALLMIFFTCYGETSAFLARTREIRESNTVLGPNASVPFTIQFHGFLALASAVPSLLGSGVLLWGGDLTRSMAQGPFEGETLALCEKLAKGCRRVVQISALLSLGVNLFQLLLSSTLTAQRFSLYLPITTLALSAALFLLCRCIQQGKALLDDSRSII